MLVEDLFDLARIHVVAAADDQLLLAIDDEEVAVLVDSRHVAGVEPAVGVDRLRGRVGPVPVALHHVVAADRDLTDLVRAESRAVVADELHLDAFDRRADRPGLALAVGMVEARDRRGLRQPVPSRIDAPEGLLERRAEPRRASPRRPTRTPKRATIELARGRDSGGAREYIVGTPSNTVTRSRSIVASATSGPKRGISVSDAPALIAAFSPQVWPKAWNSGSAPKITSLGADREQRLGDIGVDREVRVGQLRALRLPGRARRVEDHRRVAGGAVDDLRQRLGAREQLLELAGLDHDALGARLGGARAAAASANSCQAKISLASGSPR